jgi:flavorubredoxin
VGAVDWDRRLFDSLIPTPEGTSYNAYLVAGTDKTALLDTVEPDFAGVLMEQLAEVDRIDYVISHHAEQDHSGSIACVLHKYPDARVVTNEQCKEMLIDHLLLDGDRIIMVENGGTLELGGKTLEFVFTPWVHWPETMVTHLREDRILFSCDFFGSHFATSGLFVKDDPRVLEAAKRYYAEIMMPFRVLIKKNIEKVKSLDVELIAPSHGPVYIEPDRIIAAYEDWISDDVSNTVVLPYASMHGSTQKMVDHLTNALVGRGVAVERFNMAVTDLGRLAMALVDAASIVFATPTVLVGPHPMVHYAAGVTGALKPKAKYVSVIGSYGWGGKAVDQIYMALGKLKVESLEPVLCVGYPKEADLAALDGLADAIAEKHTELGLLK